MLPAPSTSAGMPIWQRSLVLLPAFGTLAALAMSLRITQLGEIWLDRTFWLTGFAAFAGLAGGAATRASLHMLTGRLTRSRERLASATLFAVFFMIAMIMANVAHFVLITDKIEMIEDLPLRAWYFVTAQVAGLFLISCPAYLLPWPLPTLMLLAGWLLPPRGREQPDKDTRNS